MPILPAEPDICPENLLEIAGDGSGWWAVYTLARREKELMRRLRAMGIDYYGPMIKRRSNSPKGRASVSFVPLFPSYVFIHGDDVARHQAMTSNCISRCLAVDDAAGLVRDLRQIQRLILSDAPLTPEAKILPGAKVRIRSGALAGTEGIVIRRHGVDRLLVAVSFLQRGASIQLEDFQVEPVED